MGAIWAAGARAQETNRCARDGHEDVNDPEKQGMSPPLSLQDKKVGFTKAIIVLYA